MLNFILKIFQPGFSKAKILLIFSVLGILINFAFIFGHFNYDDFFFVSTVEENYPYNRWQGVLATDMKKTYMFNAVWWSEQETENKFLRPIPSFVFQTTFDIFGRSSVTVLHVLSIIIHIFVSFMVFILLNRISRNHAVSLLAGFLYLFCLHHAFSVGWISTNSDLLAVLFMNIAVYMYVVFREKGKAYQLITSSFFIAIAFFCKETAVITPSAIMLYEFIFKSENGNNEKVYFLQRIKIFFINWKYWGTSFLLLAIFLYFYKTGSYGFSSLLYYDPFKEPLVYLQKLITGIPLMYLGLLSVTPLSFSIFIPGLLIPYAIAGYVLMLLLIITLYKFRNNKTIVYCFILFFIAILPQLSTDASERQLYYPYTIGSFMLSFIILQIPFLKKRISSGVMVSLDLPGKILAWYLLIFVFITEVLFSSYYAYKFKSGLESPEKFVLQSNEIAINKKADKIIYINTPGPYFSLYAMDMFRYYNRKYYDVHFLSSFNGKTWIQKISDSSLVIKTDKKGMLTSMYARVLRFNPVVEDGRVYNFKIGKATVLKTTEDKTDVLEVKIDMSINYTKDNYLFLYYNGDKVAEWNFTSMKPGEWYFLVDNSDAMKTMME